MRRDDLLADLGVAAQDAPLGLVERRGLRAGSRRRSRPCRRRAASRRAACAAPSAAGSPSSLGDPRREVGDLLAVVQRRHALAHGGRPARGPARGGSPRAPRRRGPRRSRSRTAASGCGRGASPSRGRGRRRATQASCARRSPPRSEPPIETVTASARRPGSKTAAPATSTRTPLGEVAQLASSSARPRHQHAELLAAPARHEVDGRGRRGSAGWPPRPAPRRRRRGRSCR